MTSSHVDANETSDWSVQIPPAFIHPDQETVITLRTHEIIVERKGALFTTLNHINKFLVVLSSLLLFSVSVLSIVFAFTLLNNLHVIELMKSQVVPGN